MAINHYRAIGYAASYRSTLERSVSAGKFVTVDLANLEQTESMLAELTARYSITGLVNTALFI